MARSHLTTQTAAKSTNELLWPLLAGVLILTECSGGGDSGPPPPTAVADSFMVSQGQPLNGNPNVLQNDIGTNLSAQLVGGPSHATPGSFALNANGSFSYTHNGNGAISDSFTYQAVSGSQSSAAMTVTIAIDQPPVANNSCFPIANGGGSVQQNLSATDPNGDNLTYSIVDQPVYGTVSTTPNGVFTYVPPGNATGRRGMDKFTFRATDAVNLTSQTGTVWILKDNKVRVMPLGDSITVGDGSGSGLNADVNSTGYRRPLHLSLSVIAAGKYEIDFVGSAEDGPQPADFDKRHEGHGGWCSVAPCGDEDFDGLQGHINNWLDSNPTDIVLLHIGTNDLNPLGENRTPEQTRDGINAILVAIDTWEGLNHPVTVFLARIIRDVPNFGSSLQVAALNSLLPAMINNRPTDKVLIVDMENEAGLVYGNGVPGTDMFDNVHPRQSGYDKIAAKWLSEMNASGNVSTKYLGLPDCQ